MQSDPPPGTPAPQRYVAFISYSHRDRAWAQWLHRGIERYSIPRGVVGAADRSLRPVFLDRAELPSSSDLASSVREALAASAYLIVVCSPASARSRWVNEEIKTFKALGRSERILCLIVDGEPTQASHDELGCFAPALRYEVLDGEVTTRPVPEPLAADVRTGKDDRRLARAKIVAGLLGVPLDSLVQREQARRQRRLAYIAGLAALGCVAFGALATFAWLSRNEAERQRRVAEQESNTARRTADFLTSLFEVSDPGEARGNTITAREVLDRGARQIEHQLEDEPLVQAQLATTLGEVYSNLGLLDAGAKLLERAHAVAHQPPEIEARQLQALASIHWAKGEYDPALQGFNRALALLKESGTRDLGVRTRIELGLGNVYLAQEDLSSARLHYDAALKSASALHDDALVSRALESRAQADLAAKRYDDAEGSLREALRRHIVATGELHPGTAEILNELGSLEYLRGRPALAAEYFRRTLTIERKVLGNAHPDVGVTINNLARVELEQRHFQAARALLEESLASRAEIPETEEHMTFVFANLAIANMELGDLAQARPLFEKALRAAVVNKHRLHAPILTDLAELECRSGRAAEGLDLLSQARPIMAAAYPDDPWRTALIDNVQGGCLTIQKRYAEAARDIEASLPILLQKWPPDSLYGYDSLSRATRVYTLTNDRPRLARLKTLTGS